MSVLATIIGELEQLMEGTEALATRPIPAGKFTIVGLNPDVIKTRSIADPRPAYIALGEDVGDATLPSDVSGDYHWQSRAITISTAYAVRPTVTAPVLLSTISDDERLVRRCLEEPLNLALIDGWGKCSVSVSHSLQRLEDNVSAILWVVYNLQIAFREDWSV